MDLRTMLEIRFIGKLYYALQEDYNGIIVSQNSKVAF